MNLRFLSVQLFLGIAVAHARNDAPPASDRSWAPPNLSRYETELDQRRFNKQEGGANILINPRKVYNLAELIDIAERNNPETSTFFTSKLCEIAALKSLRNKWESKNEQ
jgi:hypothetical protein